MSTLDDVKAYLVSVGVPATKWTDPQLNQVIATETAAQAQKCAGVGGAFPDLNEALCRRVYVNLSKRALAAGVTEQVGDAMGFSFVPRTWDPEIRRLEAPYRKLATG